jgi:hypothetical protein
MTEEEQLRKLKAFIADIASNRGIVDSFNSIMNASIRHGLFDRKVHHEPCGNVCDCKHHADKNRCPIDWEKGIECGIKKADWLKEETKNG